MIALLVDENHVDIADDVEKIFEEIEVYLVDHRSHTSVVVVVDVDEARFVEIVLRLVVHSSHKNAAVAVVEVRPVENEAHLVVHK